MVLNGLNWSVVARSVRIVDGQNVGDRMTKQQTLAGDEVTSVVHLGHSEYDVYIGRSDGGNGHMLSKDVGERGWLGNPFEVGEYTREQSIEEFEYEFEKKCYENQEFRDAVIDLHGKTLGCFCKPKDCHGDVIAQYVNGRTND